jgi:hypothetical protein
MRLIQAASATRWPARPQDPVPMPVDLPDSESESAVTCAGCNSVSLCQWVLEYGKGAPELAMPRRLAFLALVGGTLQLNRPVQFRASSERHARFQASPVRLWLWHSSGRRSKQLTRSLGLDPAGDLARCRMLCGNLLVPYRDRCGSSLLVSGSGMAHPVRGSGRRRLRQEGRCGDTPLPHGIRTCVL